MDFSTVEARDQSYEFLLLALAIWRESRGELLTTKQAVAWSIRNRVLSPGWWGSGWAGVILFPYQYSSFNHNDPNASKLPKPKEQSWEDSLTVADQVYTFDLKIEPKIPDPTHNSTSYYDMSLDTNPPSWSFDGSMRKTVDYGRLHFFRKT